MQLASNFHRFISFLIDEFLITILFWIIFYDDLREISQNSALISDFVKDKIYYYYALMTVYQIFFIHKYSTTLGKMALKLEIIAENGEKISASQIWLRSFVRLISGNFLYLGFVLALFTQKRQTLHEICIIWETGVLLARKKRPRKRMQKRLKMQPPPLPRRPSPMSPLPLSRERRVKARSKSCFRLLCQLLQLVCL